MLIFEPCAFGQALQNGVLGDDSPGLRMFFDQVLEILFERHQLLYLREENTV